MKVMLSRASSAEQVINKPVEEPDFCTWEKRTLPGKEESHLPEK
jgi:hypothetical protein